jgi:hypothetical protein
MGRKGSLSRNLIESKADFRFEPYPTLIDESDLTDGSIADERGQTNNVVKRLFGRCLENLKASKNFQAGALVLW